MSLEPCFSFPSTWKGRLQGVRRNTCSPVFYQDGEQEETFGGGGGGGGQALAAGVPCGASGGGEIPLIMRARGRS